MNILHSPSAHFSCSLVFSLSFSMASPSNYNVDLDATQDSQYSEIEVRPVHNVEMFKKYYANLFVTSGSMGLDLYSYDEVEIQSHSTRIIDTNIKFKFPPRLYGIIKARSFCAKMGLQVHGGVIDNDYTGEVKIIVYNSEKFDMTIPAYMKIAQLIVMKYPQFKIKQNPTLDAFPSTEKEEKADANNEKDELTEWYIENVQTKEDMIKYSRLYNADSREEFEEILNTTNWTRLNWDGPKKLSLISMNDNFIKTQKRQWEKNNQEQQKKEKRAKRQKNEEEQYTMKPTPSTSYATNRDLVVSEFSGSTWQTWKTEKMKSGQWIDNPEEYKRIMNEKGLEKKVFKNPVTGQYYTKWIKKKIPPRYD